MTPEALISVLMLAVASTWTPGPNNVMLASSGANFGFRRSVPHIVGVALGFPVMIVGVGLFLGQLFEASAALREFIRWLGAGIMLWIAWKILSAGGISIGSGRARPMRLHEAAAFQWVNPKAWAMVVAVTSQFVNGENARVVIPVIALVYAGVGMTSASGWTGFGTAMTRWLKTPGRLAWFNRTMALLIVVSVVFLFME